MLLSVDNMIVGNKGGAAILGIYVLAFNLSSWPVTAVGTAIRNVVFPAFAQLREDHNAFERGVVTATQLAWAASLPIGFSLAVLAEPFVNFVYGHKWSESAVPLVGLAVFGILRVIFDVMASALLAVGDSRRTLVIQGLWIAILAPALWFGMERFGLGGAGWAHVVVALGCTFPAYLWALAKRGLPVTELLQAASWPLLASLPATAVAAFVSRLIETDVLAVLLGGLAGVLVYFLLLVRWIRQRLAALRSLAPEPARTGHAEFASSGRDTR
jgi:PST family polysaccharide transporter